jgi:Kef-type K+ transport system membrane component KefB
MRFTPDLMKLQDTTAQIRVRGAFVLLVAFVALAQRLGLEVILGAFLAGVILRVVDQDRRMTHPQFRQKLEAIGFGVFVPIFFVVTGMLFDLSALFSTASTIVLLPIFLGALLIVHGVPAMLYRPRVGNRRFLLSWRHRKLVWNWVCSARLQVQHSSPPGCSQSSFSRLWP